MNNSLTNKLTAVRKVVAPSAKNAVWMIGGAVLAVGITVSAQQASTTGTVTTVPCPLTDAASKALNNNIKMIGLTSPDPSKYFAAGGASSCLGGISLADLDLSSLIPDPLGMISSAAMAAVDAVVKVAINKACAAARSAFGDTISQYNTAINSVNGISNGDGLQYAIDAKVGQEVNQTLGQYSTSYSAQNIAAPAPLKGLATKLSTATGTPISGSGNTNLPNYSSTQSTQTSTSFGSCLLGGC